MSICVIHHCFLSNIDVKSAFLQSGKAERDAYVKPPRECTEKRFIWLLDVATYGIDNANAKWQPHSDETLLDVGPHALGYIPQLFYLKSGKHLLRVVAKVVDDIKSCGCYFCGWL